MKNEFSLVIDPTPHFHRHSIGFVAADIKQSYYLKAPLEGLGALAQFDKESDFYKLNHDINGILPQLGNYEMEGKTFRVLPYIPNDLADLVGKISDKILIDEILVPLLDCLKTLHSRGVLHADLKLENIRIQKTDGIIKPLLADFGQSVSMGKFIPNRIGALSQHIPPDLTLTPQFDIYSLGVIAFQLLFGFDFLKKYQMAGRTFDNIPETKSCDPRVLKFIEGATSPSALYRFKSVDHALELFNEANTPNKLSVEAYNLDLYFEFYLEAMRETFIASHRSTTDFESFIGPWGESYYTRLQKWRQKNTAHLTHLKQGHELLGICESIIKDDAKGMINTLFVNKKYRGGECAQALESSAVQFFKFHKINEAHLNVSDDNNRALKFYHKCGWEVTSQKQYPNSVQLKKIF